MFGGINLSAEGQTLAVSRQLAWGIHLFEHLYKNNGWGGVVGGGGGGGGGGRENIFLEFVFWL